MPDLPTTAAGTAIALPARLTIAEARETLDTLTRAIAGAGGGGAPLRLDASPLATLDSSAVAVLLECRRAAQTAGRELAVHGAPAKLRDLARLYGVEPLLGLAAA